MKRIREFSRGLRALFRGFGFLFSHPRLWVWAILPTLINLAILAAMLAAFIHYYSDICSWISGYIGKPEAASSSAWYWHMAGAMIWILNLLIQALIFMSGLAALLIVAYAAAIVIAGPFNDALSERVETIVTGTVPPPFGLKRFLADTARVLKVELIKAAVLISIPVALFALNLIPILGSPLYVFLTLFFGAWDLGFSYADLPAGRRALPFRERWAFAKDNRWALAGLGACFAVPFFSLVFAAPMVVGGTLLYVEVTAKSHSDRDQTSVNRKS